LLGQREAQRVTHDGDLRRADAAQLVQRQLHAAIAVVVDPRELRARGAAVDLAQTRLGEQALFVPFGVDHEQAAALELLAKPRGQGVLLVALGLEHEVAVLRVRREPASRREHLHVLDL